MEQLLFAVGVIAYGLAADIIKEEATPNIQNRVIQTTSPIFPKKALKNEHFKQEKKEKQD